jgi:hypothetical protein
MKKYITLFLLILVVSPLYSQWQHIWTSSPIPYETLSGWLNFEKNGDTWEKRFYSLTDVQFSIMSEGLSQSPQYVYNFSESEKLAGLQIYSMQSDLNNDGKTDFYVLAYYGNSPYRQSVKIFDIVTGNVIFEKNDPSYYYSYPMLADINNDGSIECIVVRFDYPSFTNYVYEVYTTGVTTYGDKNIPPQFELMQNYPNPFNPSTTITYGLSNPQQVNIKIYDVLGNEIRTLVSEFKEAGNHNIEWDGANDSGVRQATGVYFYRMNAGSRSSTKKMIILK